MLRHLTWKSFETFFTFLFERKKLGEVRRQYRSFEKEMFNIVVAQGYRCKPSFGEPSLALIRKIHARKHFSFAKLFPASQKLIFSSVIDATNERKNFRSVLVLRFGKRDFSIVFIVKCVWRMCLCALCYWQHCEGFSFSLDGSNAGGYFVGDLHRNAHHAALFAQWIRKG